MEVWRPKNEVWVHYSETLRRNKIVTNKLHSVAVVIVHLLWMKRAREWVMTMENQFTCKLCKFFLSICLAFIAEIIIFYNMRCNFFLCLLVGCCCCLLPWKQQCFCIRTGLLSTCHIQLVEYDGYFFMWVYS